jgi:superfamily II DNA or RNA helicase
MYGYIYIRINEYWDSNELCKLGKAINIPDRESTYITSEIRRGKFIVVIEVELTELDYIEKRLQEYFNKLGFHVKFNGGTEFYKKDIIKYIVPYFIENKINHKVLSEEDIERLNRKTRIYNEDFIEDIQNNIEKPYDYQQLIIIATYNYFLNNDKGILVEPCGIGKTLMSLWITQKLNCNTILIGVPYIQLMEQWKDKISILFPDYHCLIISSNINNQDIIRFLENNNKCIIITTYASSYRINNLLEKHDFSFDMKINDECHHLTSADMEINNTKKYINMLFIKSKKQLSLTATIKELIDNDKNVISNDNIEYFGEIIDRKCLLWAINKNIVCDYVIQTIITNLETIPNNIFNIIDENDKMLFLSAYTALKSIYDNHSHHLLIYLNNTENSFKVIEYIKLLLNDNYFDIPNLYYSNYYGEMKSNERKSILDDYNNSRYGIISCVYCLGEGYDNPKIDGVVFAENMTSNIRIVQSALRASRKNKLEPNKIAKIILPILNDNFLENSDSTDLKKIKEVIYQMGLEDETINQKIKVFRVNIEKQIKNREIQYINNITEIGEYDDELTQNLILKTIKRTALNITYEKAKKLIADKNIKSKETYYELCDEDNRLSKEPEIVFKGKFTNWIDYLSIERIYYELETCKNKVNEYLLLYPKLKKLLNISEISYELCKIDNLFPPNGLWVEYYNIKELKEIIYVNIKKKKSLIYIK